MTFVCAGVKAAACSSVRLTSCPVLASEFKPTTPFAEIAAIALGSRADITALGNV